MASTEVNLKQPCDIEQAIITAKGFEIVGVDYMNEFYRIINTNGGLNFDFPVMAMGVNLAIAVELNLKILYYFDKGHLFNMKGKMHSLSAIYNSLSDNVKHELLADCKKLDIHADFHKPVIDFKDPLERYFDFTDNVCVNWRYYGLDETADKVKNAGVRGITQCLTILQKQITKLKTV